MLADKETGSPVSVIADQYLCDWEGPGTDPATIYSFAIEIKRSIKPEDCEKSINIPNTGYRFLSFKIKFRPETPSSPNLTEPSDPKEDIEIWLQKVPLIHYFGKVSLALDSNPRWKLDFEWGARKPYFLYVLV
jgi:hypothetical protein